LGESKGVYTSLNKKTFLEEIRREKKMRKKGDYRGL
jgi:hypothetical protein